MNERRILNGIIGQNKIPSSATLITTDNYNTVQGNVLYIPLNEYTYLSGRDLNIYIEYTSAGNYVNYLDSMDICKFTQSDAPWLNTSSATGIIYLPYYYYNAASLLSYSYGMITFSSNTNMMIGTSVADDSSAMTGMSYPDDAIYYYKIKFKFDIIITQIPSEFSNFTVYIDTEE